MREQSGSKGKRYRANFRWTFATAEDRARSPRENQIPSSAPSKTAESQGLCRFALCMTKPKQDDTVKDRSNRIGFTYDF
jgi:hypothetical protein